MFKYIFSHKIAVPKIDSYEMSVKNSEMKSNINLKFGN